MKLYDKKDQPQSIKTQTPGANTYSQQATNAIPKNKKADLNHFGDQIPFLLTEETDLQ